jgi:hypothetical protein
MQFSFKAVYSSDKMNHTKLFSSNYRYNHERITHIRVNLPLFRAEGILCELCHVAVVAHSRSKQGPSLSTFTESGVI